MRVAYFFVQELQICSTLVFDVLCLICFIIPVGFLLPFLIFFFLILVRQVEVVFSLCFFSVYVY